MMRVLTGIVAVAMLAILAGCTKEEAAGPEPVPVKVETVTTQEIRPAWRYSGEIRADTEVQLAFKQAGYIASLHQVRGADRRLRDVQVGDEIPTGTVLACLRRSDYEASLNTAVGQEGSTEGALGASQAELDQAKADQTKADLDFERAQALYAAKAMTRPDYDAAVEHHAAATASVQAAVRQIEARQGQLRAARAQVTSARISLDDTNLITPMPAVIVAKEVERGSLVAAGTNAFTIADTRVVKIAFGVPDGMLAHFKMGAAVPVEVEALQGRTLTGRITEIAASANRDSRVFNIQVSLPNRDRSLKVGMIASVPVEQADAQKVPLVPVTALITAQSGSSNYSVFTLRERDGKQLAKLQSVRIGQTIGRSVVINAGLIPGERIIVNRTNQLNDGSQVRVIE
ncbi:MAG TPA: efflux RND transporter periplasmic adaptor subunit [Bryobacteraceae bacterium]|nr:efflux RND transporter periplasmic adaptor subunit [Bryobacteraceae bacterium]